MDAGDKEVASFLQDGSQPYRLQNNSMASTVKSIAQSCVQGLVLASDSPDFSAREWVRKGNGLHLHHAEGPRSRCDAHSRECIDELGNCRGALRPSGKRYRSIAVVVDELASFDFDDPEGVLEKGRKRRASAARTGC